MAAILFAMASAVAANDVCAFPGDPSCSNAEDTDAVVSLLQTKLARTNKGHELKEGNSSSPDYAPVDDLISTACKKQCAGTPCMDPKTGSNQQLSCMQTCMMRVRGQTKTQCESQCDRNGQSGCSLTAAGFTANMCGVCTDWRDAGTTAQHGFLSNDDCKKGCAVVSPCEKQCAGTVCMDPNTGSNQMLSCMESCEMRMFGEAPEACESSCDRNGQSGCSLTASGFTAEMCSYCSDWDSSSETAKQSFLSNDDCKKGCEVGKLSIERTKKKVQKKRSELKFSRLRRTLSVNDEQVTYSPKEGRMSASYPKYVFDRTEWDEKVGEPMDGMIVVYEATETETKTEDPSDPLVAKPIGGFKHSTTICRILEVKKP